MVCKVAEVLIARGQAAQAASILQRQARLFLGEGWLTLAGRILTDLQNCHATLYQVSPLSLHCLVSGWEGGVGNI
jgi:hypothetical protein